MIILIGPSASGKTEVAKILIRDYGFNKLVTYTTRDMRINEVDGKDYNFITKENFIKKKEEGFFFETTLYNNNYYGTAKKDITHDKVVILEPSGLKSFKNGDLSDIFAFYLDCSEEKRRNFMTKRQDDLIKINERLKTDRIVFDINNIEGIDYILNSNDLSVDELAKEINKLYEMENNNEK